MYGNSYSQEQTPIFYFRGYPMYAAHTLVAAFVASMLITFVCVTARVTAPLEVLYFSSDAVVRGQVWRIVTYGLVNPPSLNFAFDMLWIFWTGREVERALGRRSFLWLYLGIYLTGPLVSLLVGHWWPGVLVGETGAFGLFIAFATFFPNAPIFFGIAARICGIILFAILEMMAISAHDWRGALILLATSALAYGWVRNAQGLIEWAKVRLPKASAPARAVRPAPPKAREPALGATSMAEVDALLDKIAQSGFNSLTVAEKARLDSARSEIRRRSDRT